MCAGNLPRTGRSNPLDYDPRMIEQRIQQQFFDSADLHYTAVESLVRPLAEAVNSLVGCLTAGGKVLACGQGLMAGSAQAFVQALGGGFERERPGLAALALRADAGLSGLPGVMPGQVLARQVQALGHPGDVLLVLLSDGEDPELLEAVTTAQEKDMTVIALTGRRGGALRERLSETDVHLAVPHERPARIHELHLLALHCLCDAVDLQLLGDEDPA